MLQDDQSKPDVARTLYEKLVTSDKVDFILGPYGTAAILAAMGVAQRYKKIFIQNTMGVPSMATYEWHFCNLKTTDRLRSAASPRPPTPVQPVPAIRPVVIVAYQGTITHPYFSPR